MTDSSLSSEVVSRMLQVTRQSWMQAPAAPVAVLTRSSRKLSSHRIAVQRIALNRRMPWGLQPTSRSAYLLEG